jgi:hypothetical protein
LVDRDIVLENIKLSKKRWRDNHKEYSRQYQRMWRENNRDYQRNRYRLNPEKYKDKKYHLKHNNNSKKKYRIELLKILGNKCIRCGFSDIRALQFDHINDDGYLDKQNMKHAHSIIAFYYKNPEIAKQRLQILCANCNWIKRYEVKKHNQYNR